jgi:hypothetical protein
VKVEGCHLKAEAYVEDGEIGGVKAEGWHLTDGIPVTIVETVVSITTTTTTPKAPTKTPAGS